MPPKRPPILRPTHFLCIPLTTPSSRAQLQSSLSTFKADVSASFLSPPQSTQPTSSSPPPPPTHPQIQVQIPPSAIRPPSTLHLTLHILNLSTPSKLSLAIKTLHSLFDEDNEHQNQNQNQNQSHSHPSNTNPPSPSPRTLLPLPPLTLHSLHSMHTPTSTSILYTTPLNPTKHLQKFCEAVRARFISAGFEISEREASRNLLLHATIVNTIYIPRGYEHEHRGPSPAPDPERKNMRGMQIDIEGNDRKEIKNESQPKNAKVTQKPTNSQKSKKQIQRRKFDAREILARYAEFTWMRDVRIEKVAICRMGARKKEKETKKGNEDEDWDGDEEYEVVGEVEVPWG